ncbi:hypothetical protein [Umezawaea sp. Da 62-37]|uniref:hypothetical protein n=1 Tax=Umezawaea sp. Da 62-37 TaxID=3075927 RepID=UPI0028F707C3|nr:hypothetical protein [Umezawaea sp. Da 62-37]WNV84872.1 hypothetical protein RM788_43055 [Umezawaea sp. Da 62-37]
MRQQDSGFGVVRPIDRTQFSIFLRRGVAASLAMLGSSDDLIRLPGGVTGSAVARQIVAEVFDAANKSGTYELWSSVSDVLPLLVEAAPDEFLYRVGVGLRGMHPLHRAMFTDDRATPIGMPTPSAHLDFVRALEILAWSPDHFDDAVDVLAKLAVIDPGGKWSNRPAASLTGIFSCWHPNTTADEEQRIGALRRLLRSTPDVARNLLVSLIPTNHMTQTPHSGPRFRDWRREQRITHDGLRHAVGDVVDILLEDLDGDPDRYLSVIRKIEHVSSGQRDRLACQLIELAETITDDDARRRLRDALREKIAHHREFATSDWAMPGDEFRCLEQAVSALEPRTIILHVAWLFSSGGPALSDRSRREDSAAYAVAIRERRAEAIGQVLAEHGLTGIETLARMTDYPYLVGVGLSDHTSDFDVAMLGKLSDGPPMQTVAHAYLQTRLFREGESLRDRLLDLSGSPAEQAAILNASVDAPSAWRALHGLSPEVSELYWKTFSHHGIPSIATDVTAAAVGLLGVRRYAAVVDLVSLHAEEIDSIEVAELAATACEGMLVEPPSAPEMHMLSEYDFQRVFAMLARHRDTIGHQRIATLEWHLFPFLGFQAEAPTLHATLSDEPSFFVELVCRVYRRDDEDRTELHVENEERERMATRAFEVLRSWRRCPGVSADGTVDLGSLRVWTVDARERLREAARAGAGDSQIGQAFAYAPPDHDDLFPPRAVRDLLEELASEDIDRGLNIGIFNKRGVVARGMTDGGAQEQSLAGTYRQRAAESNLWPRTRRILRDLAETYEHQARREEEEAEHRRRGLPD